MASPVSQVARVPAQQSRLAEFPCARNLSRVLVVLLGWSAGCREVTSDLNQNRLESESTAAADKHEIIELGSKASLTLTPIDAQGLQNWVNEQQGRVVLVDCWALWCLNCLEEMPRIVAWERQWRGSGLIVASLNFDPPGDLEKRLEAAAHLGDLGVSFIPFQSSVSPGSKAMDDFGIDAGLPHYRVYDRQGNLVATFDDAGPELEAQLQQLLETKAP